LRLDIYKRKDDSLTKNLRVLQPCPQKIGVSAPAYFKVILNPAATRIFNATRAHKRDRVGPLQNVQEFLALNRHQLEQALTSMFFGHHVTYFPIAVICVNIESVGLGIAGLLDVHDNWAVQTP
jgi:hypothetical protein